MSVTPEQWDLMRRLLDAVDFLQHDNGDKLRRVGLSPDRDQRWPWTDQLMDHTGWSRYDLVEAVNLCLLSGNLVGVTAQGETRLRYRPPTEPIPILGPQPGIENTLRWLDADE